MPKELLKAHRELDLAVDRAYRKEPFANDEERLAFLFQLYEKLTTSQTLLPNEAKDKPKKRRKS